MTYRLLSKIIISLLLTAALRAGAQEKLRLRLWYDKPAGDTWENALPIGNGRLGAMVYGNVERETIQLNEHTLWSGRLFLSYHLNRRSCSQL